MADSQFLSLDHVLRLHGEMIQKYGGSPALLNRGLLESAVATPAQSFSGQLLHPDLPSQAAVYLYHLVQNHAFEDGNKRIGSGAAIVFLLMNDVEIHISEDQLVDMTLQVTNGTMTKDNLITFFRQYVSTT